MQRSDSLRPARPWRESALWTGALAVALAWLGLGLALKMNLFGHSAHDSYTLMALAWRKGMLSLGKDYPWLELAVYNGDWYVSFPSVPALVMLPLTLLFGENTPNTLAVGLYFLGSYIAAYHLARRFREPAEACFMALFMCLGCNMLDLSLTGDVWYQAQLLSFLLTTCCALGLTGESRRGWVLALFCLALSVGCRPFQAVYAPFALAALWRKLNPEKALSPAKTLLKMLPYLIAPALVAVALGWYNWARFGNPLEFGHNYLPEFTRDPELPQMGLKYVGGNILNLLRLPYFNDGRLEFERFNGFAFWLANPIYVTAGIAMVVKAVRRRWDLLDALLLAGFAVELFLTLMHKTLGGWQFGARYLCDLVPMLLLIELRGRDRVTAWERAIGLFAIAFNLYGTAVFHLIDKGV